MVSWNFIQWNIHYIGAINSCDRAEFGKLLDDMLKLPGGFTRKRYIWNIIRGKDFYKNLAYYTTSMVEGVLSGEDLVPDETMRKVEDIIEMVTTTEKRYSVRKSFIWNITKQVPLLTVGTIPYMSQERLTSIITSTKRIAADTAIAPFISEIYSLRAQLDDSRTLMDTMLAE